MRVFCGEVGLPAATSVTEALGSAVALDRGFKTADWKVVLINNLEEAVELSDCLRLLSSGDDVPALLTELGTTRESKGRIYDVVSKVRGDLV